MSPALFISAQPGHAARVKAALDELNRYAVSPKYGASLEQLKAVHKARKAHPVPKGVAEEGDLVTKLITDPDLTGTWNDLLTNAFCTSMGATGSDDANAAALLQGFKAYMVQDYIYCTRGIIYQTERSIKSTTHQDFNDTTKKVQSYCDYARGSLNYCVNQPDTPDADGGPGLGLKDVDVLQATPADVLNEYTDFQIQTAETHNWVMSLVAMIPCIQSYYAIAKPLYDNAPDKIKDTQWYKLWIEPNGNVSEDDAGVTAQKTFFITNYAVWKDHYAEAKETFRRACKGEIDLWKFAQDAEA